MIMLLAGIPVLFALVSSSSAETKPPAASTPNGFVIPADDMGLPDAGCYGGEMATPNLDRLASRSTCFKQSYVAATVCSPTRCAFLTSHLPARHEIHGRFAEHAPNAVRHMPDWLDPETVTLTKLGRDAG